MQVRLIHINWLGKHFRTHRISLLSLLFSKLFFKLFILLHMSLQLFNLNRSMHISDLLKFSFLFLQLTFSVLLFKLSLHFSVKIVCCFCFVISQPILRLFYSLLFFWFYSLSFAYQFQSNLFLLLLLFE